MLRPTLLAIFLIISTCSLAQSYYSVSEDPRYPGKRMLIGLVSPYILSNDSSFSWYSSNQKGYNIPPNLLKNLESAKERVHFIVFAGTWCEDSHFIIPRFFRALEAAGFPDKRVVFYALDRDKKMPGGLQSAFGVSNVPTIIVMKNGKESGRVVEYGKTGKWDEELAELVR